MNDIANQLAQSLFKKNSLQECSRWELEILADKYPYFGIAQFLLAGKLKEEDAEAYKKQIQKTSLYFTNPLWLDYTLNNESSHSTEIVKPGEAITEEHTRFAPKTGETLLQEETIYSTPETETQSTTEQAIDVQTGTIVDAVAETEMVNEIAGEISTDETETEVKEEEQSHVQEKEEEVVPSQQDIQAQAPEQSEREKTVEPEMKIAPLKMEPMPDPNAPLVFEAFHTVDYFASQGIKLKIDDLPKDRFGQQLKSFTEWLKTLKKTTPTEISKQADKGIEQKVITLAEHSIENPDVLTETMAEVWLKQGNKEKAIEVYNKLSLQNPAKSSYFAALIEQLKQQ